MHGVLILKEVFVLESILSDTETLKSVYFPLYSGFTVGLNLSEEMNQI